MNRISLLWIDDQFETEGSDFIAHAEQKEIDIIAFASSEEGITSLLEDPLKYSAVILDAYVKNGKNDEKLGLSGLRNSRDALIAINKQHHLPFYIFTGQPGYASSEDFIQSYGEIFIKGRDNTLLLDRIRHDYGTRPQDLIRKKYPEVFEAFNMGLLDSNARNLAYNILINIENQNFEKKNIAPQRDLFEAILKCLSFVIPHIPKSFYGTHHNNNPNQDYCVKFLEGRKVGNEETFNDLPQNIKSIFRKLKESLNDYSHLKDEEIIKYPLLANSYLLLEILTWLPSFAKTYYPNYI